MNKDDQNQNLNKATSRTNSKNYNTPAATATTSTVAAVESSKQPQKTNSKNKKNHTNSNNNNNNSLKLAAATTVAATISTIATNNNQQPQNPAAVTGSSNKKSSKQGNATAGRQNNSSASATAFSATSLSSSSASTSNTSDTTTITTSLSAIEDLDNGASCIASAAPATNLANSARLKNTNTSNNNNNTNTNQNNAKIKLKVNNNNSNINNSSNNTTTNTPLNQASTSASTSAVYTANGNKMPKNSAAATATTTASTTLATTVSIASNMPSSVGGSGVDIDMAALNTVPPPSTAVTSTATGTVPTITSSKSATNASAGVGGISSAKSKKSSSTAAAAAAAALALQQQAAAVSSGKSALSSASAKSGSSSKDAHLKFTSALPLLVGSAAAAAAAAKGAGASSSAGAQAAAAAAAALKQKLKSAAAASSVVAAAAASNSRSNSTSTSSNSSSLSSSVGIVNAISNALQNIITSDNSDTDTELYPPPVTDLSESDEESVSEDDIPESDPDSCGHDAEGHEEEDDGDDEDEDEDEEDEEDDDDENEDDDDDDDDDEEDEEEEIDDDDDDEEIQDPNEVSGDFLLDTNNDRSNRNLNALFEAAANEKAPVLRHATHAIDETKQALTKMRGASSDKTMFSRTLIAACNDNDVNTVRSLLGKGNVNINESTDDGESLLSMACSAGYYELAQVLLAMSAAQVEDKGQKDCTPLMEAASAGHLEIVKLLLSHNADVNAHCATGNTPLMFACAGGHVEVVKELLKHGANVEEQNENGHTPLMEAASAGHVEVAKVLLEHGAGINTHSNEFKESALTLACYKGHLNMVRFLLQAGADQEHKTDEMHTALMEASMDGHVEVARLLLDSGAQVNMPTDSFESPLTLAACGGHVELATLLIERGANIEEVNDEGYTPLMEAAREGHEEMVALLLSKGANINATTEETQETALTLACCGGFSEVAEYLIKHGANLELGASTPLMEAAQEGHTDLVRFLLENKANVHAETQTGDTALTHACENGHTDAAEVLLSYGAELEHESEGGRTPLMKACRAGHLCTVKFLISKGADVNKQTSSNDHTPLSLACAGGHQAVVEYLLKIGADPFHKLKDNSTMLIEAAKGGHTRVVELLFKYPHFIQNHQNELQSAAAAAAAAAAVGINNTTASSAAANQLHLINLQQQKQLQQQQKQLQQQLQLQLQQLSAPPGLHEVSEAARANNQQIFHHQQYTTNNNAMAGGTNEYLEEQLQLQAPNANATEAGSNQVVACNEEYAAIDINSLSAQQQEALIAKSRLFHLQAGFGNVGGGGTAGVIGNNNEQVAANLNNQQQQQQQQQQQLQQRKHFDLDMSHIMPLTPPQKQPPAPPVLQAQQPPSQTTSQPLQQQASQQQPQQQIKLKGNQRKSRQQPPQPFEVSIPNTANASNNNNSNNTNNEQQQQQQQMQDIERSQPLGDDGLGNKPQQQSTTQQQQQQQLQFSCFNDDSRFIRRRVLRQDFNKLSNDQKNIPATLLPASYLDMTGGNVNSQNQNVGDGADAITLNQNLLAVAPAMGDGSEMQPVIIASPEPLNFAPNQALMMQELFDPNNPQTPLTLATTLPQGTQFVLGPAPPPQQQQQLQQTQSQQPQTQQQQQRIVTGKTTQKSGGITTPSEVSQSTAISDRPKAKPVSKKDGKILRKTTTQSTAATTLQQPLFRQNQMVSIYNNLPMLITNEATPSLQTQQAIMNHMVFAAQQHQQQQIALDVVNDAQVVTQQQQPQQQGVIALSNSPASPLASPSSGATALCDPQLQQFMEIQAAEDMHQQQPENEQTAQEIQEALDAALSDSKLAVTDSLNALSKANAAAAAAAVAKACGLNPAEQQECLKKLQEGWQIVDLRQRIFHKQPKSPTETPPDKQIIDITNLENELDSSETDANNEMKNLATLCTAAAQAAAVNVTAGETDTKDSGKTTVDNSKGSSKKQRKLSKKEKLSQQDGLELCRLPEPLKDNYKEERRNSVDDRQSLASEVCHAEDDVNSSDLEQQEEDSCKSIQELDDTQLQLQLKSPTKGIKPISQRLENLILSNAPLKPGDLSQAFTDLRQEIGADVLTVFPQNMNLKFAGNTALSNALQQHLAAVKQQIGDVTEDSGDGMLQVGGGGDNDSSIAAQSNEQQLVYPSSMDAETLEQFANAAAQANNNNNDNTSVVAVTTGGVQDQVVGVSGEQTEEGMREEMYDIEVEMDDFFHVIHNVHDPALQEFASNLNCGELADFGINSICKTRWNGNWALTPKWTSQDQLISAAAAAHHQQQQQQQGLLATNEEQQQQQEQQRQANQLLLDYQLQQQLQQRFADADEMQMQQHQHQQTTLSLIPFSPEDAAAASAAAAAVQQQQQLQTLPTATSATNTVAEYQLQQQQQQHQQHTQHHGLDQELKQHIQQLHQQQQTNVRLLKAVAAAAANQQQQQQLTTNQQQQNVTNNNNNNFVFNVDGCGGVGSTVADKSSQSLQLLFQLPPTVQQQQQQQQDDVAATAQQLQHLKLHHQELQDQQKQQQQQLKLLQQQEQDLSQTTAESLMQQQQQQQQTTLEQVAQNNLLLQQQAALAQQVLNQQVLKQKQQQLLMQQQQQSTQVQVSTQTQSSVVVPHPNAVQVQTSRAVNNQFCPTLSTMAAAVDVGLGSVCALTPQQQQLQQQQQQQQHQTSLEQQMLAAGYAASVLAVTQHQQLPVPAPLTAALNQVVANASSVMPPQASTSSGSSKMPGGIAKKVIDKQSRKERNRYSLLRSAAGSQANAAAQQQYQQTVAATTALDKTIDVDSETDSNHDTALTLACAGGHEELVELLINRGANIEHRDKKGFTPLILAATAGHEKVVDILLKHGADLEAQSERTKDTPLSLACSGGRYEVVELLLGIGANKEHRNVSDYTPLSLAASGGYVNIIKLLLSNGAEINSRTGSKLGISPLMLAAMNGHTAAVKLLLDQGSDINAQIETNRNTALTLACFQGRHEVVSLLLDRKANVEHRAKTGLTPLMEAASGGYIEVGRVLLDKGADVNAAPVPTSRDTALTIAADKGHLKFVELLLARGAAVEVKNKKGNSPLWLAAHGGHLSVVDILYNHNADIDSQDNRRVSCLMAAFRKGHTKTVRWMVQYVTQFPSDQEMNRFISTISDKELSEKCYDCMKIIRAAKEAQAVKANKNASILLEELDMERTREESRRAAAARRRERKKKKKMEKKEEKRRQMEEATGGSSNQQEQDDKDSDKDEESDHEDNNAADEDDDQQNPQNYREEGDSGIDQGSCSSTDIKASVGNSQNNDKSVGGGASAGGKNKNKKKNKQQNTRNSSPVVEEPQIVQPAPAAKQQQQQNNKKKDESTNSKAVSNSNKKNAAEQNTLAAKTQSNNNNANASNKKSDHQHKKEEVINNNNNTSLNTGSNTNTTAGNKKKESNKQKEKENLAPKELTAAGTAQYQPTPQATQTNSHSHIHNNKQQQQHAHVQQQANSNNKSETSSAGNRKSLIFSASKTAEENNKRDMESIASTTLSSTSSNNKPHPATSVPKRGEDGWKEVVRKSSTQQSTTASATSGSASSNTSTSTAINSKESTSSTSTTLSSSSNSSSSTTITVPGVSTTTTVTSTAPEMTCKKVQVPVNAISRVIGRAGSNINAIRATTGAHIEVEKQGKNQSERSITIKGLTEATKQAHMLILALIKDPDVDILQMLPRINTTIKASVVPPASTTPPSSISTMQVGTWDNKTAMQSSSGGQSSNMSSGSSTTSSASSTPGTNLNSKTTGNLNSKSNTKLQGGIGSNQNKSAIGRTQPSKPFYAQQTLTSSRGSGVGAASNNSNQMKHKDLNSKGLSGPGFSQKSAGTPGGKTTGTTFGGSGVNNQTFAAKLLTGGAATSSLTGNNSSPTKKSELGGLQRSGITAPYGRGKPVPSSTIPSLGSVGVLNQNNNTLSGPIGTFNVAEAAAAVAAANAAAAQAANHNAASSNKTARSVTPIGPPNKQRAPTPTAQQQSAGHINNNVTIQATQSMQQQQNLHINTGNLGDNVNPTGGSASLSTPGSFGAQLAAKISSEYSLFNDYHQSQWGSADNSQNYPNPNALVNDNVPQADASKAPGYNRNILSSPVGSSKASNSSTPPGNAATSNLNVASQQTLTILPESGVAPIGSTASQAARSPAGISVVGNDLTPPSAANAGQAAPQQQDNSAISPNVIKPPGAIGQAATATCPPTQQQQANPGNVSQPPPSGLAIQRPQTSGQHRANASNNSTQQSPPSAQPNVADNSGNTLNFGPIGPSNSLNRGNNPAGAIGEQPRFYDPTNQMNVAVPMGFQIDPSLMQQQGYNSANSRLNPRASVFGGQQPGNKSQTQSSQALASALYHQQQQPPTQQNQQGNVFNATPGKPVNVGQNLAPQRPQSQPQTGQTQNQRWYGTDYAGMATAGGYVPPSTRDILNLENGSTGGLGGAGANSPAAMSPSQGGNVNANNPAGLLQTPPQMPGQQSADDMRKIPRPIGTERASWKYNNYPGMANMGMGVGGLAGAVGLATMDDNLAAMTAAAAGIPGAGIPTGPLPPWLLGTTADKQAAAAAVQQQQQQQQQHSNWMKQQYRYYNQGAAGAGTIGGLTGLGGPADYHHQQDQFHMALDYHNTMPPPNLNQNQPMNLIPTYTTYPHFLGHVGGNDMSHMPEKIELWDHHDKHTWTSNWTN